MVFNDIQYTEKNLVFYQEKNKKAWNGPVKVFCHRGRDVWIWANGDLKKVASCKVQPYKVYKGMKNEEIDNVKDSNENVPDGDCDEVSNHDEPKTIGKMTRSRASAAATEKQSKKNDLKKDTIGAYWLSKVNECFDDTITTFVVEVPMKDHNTPEVLEAKAKEHKNLQDFATYEEV